MSRPFAFHPSQPRRVSPGRRLSYSDRERILRASLLLERVPDNPVEFGFPEIPTCPQSRREDDLRAQYEN